MDDDFLCMDVCMLPASCCCWFSISADIRLKGCDGLSLSDSATHEVFVSVHRYAALLSAGDSAKTKYSKHTDDLISEQLYMYLC